VRALWTWPLATGIVTLGELAARSTSFDAGAFALALAAGSAMGTWPAVLTVLLAAMARRRGWSLPARLRPRPQHRGVLASGAVLAVVLAAVAVWLADVALAIVAARPIDYLQTARQLVHGAVLLAVPVAVLVVVRVAAPLARWLDDERRARMALRVAGLLGALALAAHFGGGAFVVYFGSSLAVALVILAAIVAAIWLPREIQGRAGAIACAALPLVVALGMVGLHHRAARALWLHHGRLAPGVLALGVGFADRDGDGDLPGWLGGGDCDDGDETIGSMRPELPANGVDDNCWAGDRGAPADVPTPAVQSGPRPVLLFVTIDTVRADRLELYGADRRTMPALAAVAARGLVFERAYAAANHTFYAMTAMLAGQSTERMLVPVADGLPQLRYTRWLPQRLRDVGYHVVAISPPLVADGKLPPQDLRVDEIDMGPFDGGTKNRGTTARQIADAAIERIETWQGDRPLALWLHFDDPHAVHESPIALSVGGPQDAYEGELSWVDLHLGRVLGTAFRRFGDDVLLVVTADHGESFGEDGDWGHGFTLYEREIRVPLVISGPGVPTGRRGDPVSTIALAPTVLALLGQPSDPGFDLPSLVDGAAAPVLAENPAFLWNELRMEAALVEGDAKIVWARTTNTIQLFDLAADPDERTNLAAADPAERDRMFAALRDALEQGR